LTLDKTRNHSLAFHNLTGTLLTEDTKMARELIITMAAANRAGILAAVTKAMAELGSDLREASQTVVRGHFTMIFSAEFPDTMDISVIRDHLQDACRPFGIDLGIRDPAAHTAINSGLHIRTKLYRLRLGGHNQPGALLRLSQLMSMKSIDITGMHALRTDDGQSFEMVLKLAVPEEYAADQLLNDLNNAGREFDVTADLREFGE
jgi:predicted amino acid-binding ACT domain protein